MRGESPGGTLQTTALVNEAYLRLVATDRAGNTVHCDTAQPVALDDLYCAVVLTS